MYFIRLILWNVKSSLASPGRSHVGPALYVYSLLGYARLPPPPNPYPAIHSIVCTSVNIIPEVLVNIAYRELILQREKPVICPLRSKQSKISKVGLATHLSDGSKKD
jgi:hypothetical protein